MLVFQNKVKTNQTAFLNEVIKYADLLGISPHWLMAIINWESAGTFDAAITNSIGATGLIQFMPQTAIALGTTTAQLRQMTNVQQLYYVYKYYLPYKSKIKSYTDLYLATLFPVALGKPDSYVLETKSISASTIASQNPAFDFNKDKKVTVGEVKRKMLEQIPKEFLNLFDVKK